jgi:hypothetical protein
VGGEGVGPGGGGREPPPKLPPEEVLQTWAREWFRDGREMNLGKRPSRPALEKLPRRWVAERTLRRFLATDAWPRIRSGCARRPSRSSTRP